MSRFSKVVKVALKTNKMSVTQLAQTINLSVPYIYNLLKGDKRWNEPTMYKVSDVLGISIEFKVKAS